MSYLAACLAEKFPFADLRYKKPELGSVFRVDDRGPGDTGADDKTFHWFCEIFVRVVSDQHAVITLIGGVPFSDGVTEVWGQRRCTLDVRRGDSSDLEAICKRLGSTNPKSKFDAAGRTAKSLTRLLSVLREAWTQEGLTEQTQLFDDT